MLSIDLSSHATTSSTYTTTVIDDKLLLKANKSTTYTKTEVDDKLLLKANKSTTYTKTEIDDKWTLTQPVFTALDPLEKGFDLSDINNPVGTLGLKQSFLDTVNGKQDVIDTNTILHTNRLSLSDLTKLYIDSPGATTRINAMGIQFGNQSPDYQPSSAQISAALHTADTLEIVGMGTEMTNRRIKLWAEGGLTLKGRLTTDKHSLTDTSVNFGTPVTCQYDLSCGTLTASSIYGGASSQNPECDCKRLSILDCW